jgi:hypothetical protein
MVSKERHDSTNTSLKGGQMEDNISLKNKIDTIFNQISENNGKPIKTRQMKIPRRAKVRRGRIKKRWVGIIKISENGNISGEKSKIEGGAFTLKKEGSYHATDGREIRYWNGKFPVLFQPTWRLNPINFSEELSMNNETYGQKYIMAKMLKNTIKSKGKGFGSIIIWIIVAVGAFFLVKYLFKF